MYFQARSPQQGMGGRTSGLAEEAAPLAWAPHHLVEESRLPPSVPRVNRTYVN